MLSIRRPHHDDREAWEDLFRSYLRFYGREEPQAMYDRAWSELRRDERMHARVACWDGRVVGIVHFLVHANTSRADVCYLQDLYTADDMRGQGIGRALIAAVVDFARQRECSRVYWLTHETNAVARRLYDSVGECSGFVEYEVQLQRDSPSKSQLPSATPL
ncbi:MAG TPA: GNAT family N-acetyltransferase [Gemmatimonadaceae bacterium]